jgi:hypothetical protein
MPLVKKRLTIAAGATSDQVLQGTTYEYVDPGTQLVVAAGDATGTYSGAVTMDFTVNNAEFSKDAIVSEEVTGEAFGWRGGYVLNDMVTTGQVRNRPVITFTNGSGSSATIAAGHYTAPLALTAGFWRGFAGHKRGHAHHRSNPDGRRLCSWSKFADCISFWQSNDV